MIAPTYRFENFHPDHGKTPSGYETFSYPMGDTTIRKTPTGTLPKGTVQTLTVQGPTVDWTIVGMWATLSREIYPAARRALILPYLPSARGDKDVPSPAKANATMAAGTDITDLVTVDPHSPVWVNTLKAAAGPSITVHTITAADLITTAISAGSMTGDYAGVIAPDAGAKDRAGAVADTLGLPVLTAVKHRDPASGRITGYEFTYPLASGPWLVVDDIFDGGATFGILRDHMPRKADVDLWVTHGGFTGPDHSAAVIKRYRTVYTTDSLRSATELPRVQPIPLDASISVCLTSISKGKV